MRAFLINGKWIQSSSELRIVSPWPGVECESVCEASAQNASDAARFSVEAFHALRRMTRYKRAESLRFISSRIDQLAEEFAKLIRDECGKPMGLARVEVKRAVQVFLIAAEECLHAPGEIITGDREPHGVGISGRVERFPVGPVLGITPFNFPLNLAAHKIAPALAAGCSIVIKPPPQAPGAALLLGQIVLESGLHTAALQVLPGGLETAKALCACPEFAAISFTGSAAAGWGIKKAANPRQKVLLELGGDAALLVDEFADLDAAASAAAIGGYAYAGQICISTQRVLVHRKVADEFERKLATQILNSVGTSNDPNIEGALVGPLIDAKSAERVDSWVRSALDSGAKALVRGERKGPNFITPWLLESVPHDQPLCCEEVFGPVMLFNVVSDFEEGLRQINASRFGLQASVFTRSSRNAEMAYRELDLGGVVINLPTTFRLDTMPYGGVKDSGFGREGVPSAIREFSEPKLFLSKN